MDAILTWVFDQRPPPHVQIARMWLFCWLLGMAAVPVALIGRVMPAAGKAVVGDVLGTVCMGGICCWMLSAAVIAMGSRSAPLLIPGMIGVGIGGSLFVGFGGHSWEEVCAILGTWHCAHWFAIGWAFRRLGREG